MAAAALQLSTKHLFSQQIGPTNVFPLHLYYY